MNTALSIYRKTLHAVKVSAVLEKYAETDSSVLEAKTAHDVALFQMLKEAGIGSALKSVASKLPEGMGKGLAIGTGAAIPAGLAGGALIHQAGNEARETSSDLRNKALQTALGVGAIGAGLYGLHRATAPTKQQSIHYGRNAEGQMVPMSYSASKTGAVEPDAEEILTKLSTVGYLDAIFEHEEKTASDDSVRRKVAECRMLNAEHGIQLLRDLLV